MTEVREPETVNGINVEELKALIAGVAENPGNGTTNWRVSTSWQGQTRSRARVDGFGIGGAHVSRSFSIDIAEPCELGGTNAHANPQEHTLAAPNACMMVGYVPPCPPPRRVLESLGLQTDL